MVENGSKFIPKNPPKFICNLCDYLTSNSKDFKKHTETIKHKKRTNDSKMIENNNEFPPNNVCYCGKSYKYNSGYYRHKKNAL